MLSWDITLLDEAESVPHQSQQEKKGTGERDRRVDVGFSVLGKTRDGFFPMLTPYR